MNWNCANVLLGVGDSFSFDGAKGFIAAAKQNGIDVCLEHNFNLGSKDVTQVIKTVISRNCCKVTVTFAPYSDYAALLLEARKQNYDGEWILGSNAGNGVNEILKNIGNNHEIMRGVSGFT